MIGSILRTATVQQSAFAFALSSKDRKNTEMTGSRLHTFYLIQFLTKECKRRQLTSSLTCDAIYRIPFYCV